MTLTPVKQVVEQKAAFDQLSALDRDMKKVLESGEPDDVKLVLYRNILRGHDA
jgi:hypothetical protein